MAEEEAPERLDAFTVWIVVAIVCLSAVISMATFRAVRIHANILEEHNARLKKVESCD